MAEITGKTITELRVIDLKHQLKMRGLDRNGVKKVLLQRLSEALEEEGHDTEIFVFRKKQNTETEDPERDITDSLQDAEQPEEVVQENGIADENVDEKCVVVEDEPGKEEEQEQEDETHRDVEPENVDNHQGQDMEVCNDEEDADNCPEKKQSEKDKPQVIWIMNLSINTNAIELKSNFLSYGQVVTAKILTANSPYYEAGTLFGHLEMAFKEDAIKAITAMDNTVFKGKTIRVLNNQDFLKERESLKQKKPEPTKRPLRFKFYDCSREDGRRFFGKRRTPPGEPPYRKQATTFHLNKNEGERQRTIDRDHRDWQEERRRQVDDTEISRTYKEESKREHEKIRREKDKLRREREEHLERQRERFEREKLHEERMELERSVYKLEEDRRMETYSDEQCNDRRHQQFEEEARGHSRGPRRSSNVFRDAAPFQNFYREPNDRPRNNRPFRDDRERNSRPSNRYQNFDNDRWLDNGHHQQSSGPVYHQPRNDRFHYTGPMGRY